MRRLLRRATVVAAAAVVLTGGAATAHQVDGSKLEDDGVVDSGKETHTHDEQHGGHEGHLPGTSKNVRLVGVADVADGAGRTADVSAKGNYAYLARFYEPTCSSGGIDVVDISNPAAPKHVSTIPSHTDTFTGEGSQVITMKTASFTGDLLVYSNEICPGAAQGVGGVTLVDVSNPLRPKKLVEGFGDFTVKGKSQTHANEIHSAFAWNAGAKTYVVTVDNEESTDIDILDITNPSRPSFVSETDLTSQTQQAPGAVHGDAVFLHDMVVKQIGTKQIMLVSYWDGGYAKLDVTNPAKPVFLADTDYPQFDPVRAEYGQKISPEGNGHQAEFTRDNKYFIATDEDFDPYRYTATITAGANAGTTFTAVQATNNKLDADTPLRGATTFVGQACGTLPPAEAGRPVAVIERGTCDFTVKVANAEAAGYTGVIIFNRTGVDGCETLLSMLVDFERNIPAVFVSRKDGFRILGQDVSGYSCTEGGAATDTPTPAFPANGSTVDISGTFDGWGYVHLYDAGTMAEVDTYALPESQDARFADGFGDLSVHEVATDPDTNLAYLSYYAGGFRVVKYGPGGLTEVGRFIAPDDPATTAHEGGNNFWGVEVHKHPNGQKYVLASDRDHGLYIFQYTGP